MPNNISDQIIQPAQVQGANNNSGTGGGGGYTPSGNSSQILLGNGNASSTLPVGIVSAADIPLKIAYPFLRSPKFLPLQVLNSGTSEATLGTVPTGKKWIVLGALVKNGNGTSSTVTLKFAKNGSAQTYNSASTVVTTVSQGSITVPSLPTLYAGDSLVAQASLSGTDYDVGVIECDAASPIFSDVVTSLVSGNNVVTTVPSGYQALFVTVTGSALAVGNGASAFMYSNESGTSKNVYGNIVKSGGSASPPGVGSNCMRAAAASVATANRTSILANTAPLALQAGDSLSLNTSGTGAQAAWTNYILWEAP